MKLKFEVISDHEFVLNTVDQMLEERDGNYSNQFDSTIDYAIVELTKIKLRDLAQLGDRRFKENKDALNIASNAVQEEIQKRNPQFVINKNYRKSLHSLSYPALEIMELTNELSRSREIERIGNRISLPNSNNIYEIVQIGLSGSIEGLLAKPVSECVLIDLDNFKEQHYDINGEWFPFEIMVEDFIFILDDDATIYISTDNFPERLLSEAKKNLMDLVTALCN